MKTLQLGQILAWLGEEMSRRLAVVRVVLAVVCVCALGCSKTDRIRVRAVLGNADAEAALADMYYRGDGRPKDLTEAARWFRRAAEQGNAAAQYNLGTMYANGEGVPRDASQAAKWYQDAAKQGDDDSENELGRMYWTGDGVQRDLSLAAAWSRKAAEQGNRIAQFRLGLMYMGGEGVPEDRVQAHMWLELCAPSRNGEARAVLASLETKLTSEELAEAERLAREWRQEHPEGRR
ncbi:MAG TPA: tetratricopeptide repeat protein [Myxococcota bacterium]|nr:tetratricopeptide repeat protein [Myxococcota bacterium]